MLNIPFADSGVLKYFDSEEFHYSYSINTFDYPTMHSHEDYWEFCILTDGTLKNCIFERGVEYYSAKTLSFMTTKDCHAYHKASDTLRYINLPVRESQLLRMLEVISPTLCDRLLQGPRCFPITDSLILQIEYLIYRCNLLGEEQVDQKNGLLCSAVLLILQELNRIYLDVDESLTPFMKKLLPLRERKEFLRYSVSDLGHALNYSSAHLNRLFASHFQMTPREYLMRHKFRYARNLLQSTDLGMQEIAAEIGYSNLSHFFANFKSLYGITPGECRRGEEGMSVLPLSTKEVQAKR